MNSDRFREIIQSCHLNFLIGSGCSKPFLETLGQIENYLAQIDDDESISLDNKIILKASILKKYFDDCICGNLELLNTEKDKKCLKVLSNYKDFVQALNNIVLNRKTSILNKQVNLFTTNMDIFLEHCIEELKVECNDGFSGRMNPTFSLTNFRKSIYKTSSHYDNISELPVFNLYKIHGSVAWNVNSEKIITLDNKLTMLEQIKRQKFESGEIVNLLDENTENLNRVRPLSEMVDEVELLVAKSANHEGFLKYYEQLPIVNPTKEKFKHTTLHYTYYELLRMFSNELEKENSVLFVIGFSFSDEHIREIILRSVNSNPTLLVCIFGYDPISDGTIRKNLNLSRNPVTFENLVFISRCKKGDENSEEKEFDLETVTEQYFGKLSNQISTKQSINA